MDTIRSSKLNIGTSGIDLCVPFSQRQEAASRSSHLWVQSSEESVGDIVSRLDYGTCVPTYDRIILRAILHTIEANIVKRFSERLALVSVPETTLAGGLVPNVKPGTAATQYAPTS